MGRPGLAKGPCVGTSVCRARGVRLTVRGTVLQELAEGGCKAGARPRLIKMPEPEKTLLWGAPRSCLRKLMRVIALGMQMIEEECLIWKLHMEVRHGEGKKNSARNGWGNVLGFWCNKMLQGNK